MRPAPQPELVAAYRERITPKPEHAAERKKRTLTHLYNATPAWLDHAHYELDRAVAAAYCWGKVSSLVESVKAPSELKSRLRFT